MLEPQERTALLLLIGVVAAVLTAHLVLEAYVRPLAASPFSTSSTDGELVSLEGRIEALSATASGGHLLLTVAGVPVFVPAPVAASLDLHENDSVALYGVVQTYRGKKEIVVESPGDIRILT